MESDNFELKQAKVSYSSIADEVNAYIQKDTGERADSLYHIGDYNWYQERYVPYFPNTYNYTIREDNYKKAFDIAKMLLAKDLIKSYMLPDFIKLVEEIAAKI